VSPFSAEGAASGVHALACSPSAPDEAGKQSPAASLVSSSSRRTADGPVVAVLLCWNDADRVASFVQGLRAMDPAPDRIVVVDNGSRGDAAGRLRRACPEVEVLALAQNAGFAAGMNRGIEWALSAGAGWVWVLNTDLTLPADALAKLHRAASRDSRTGMAAPLLVEADGAVQAWGGGRVDLRRGDCVHLRGPEEAPDYLSGACLLLRAAMLREIGAFDERFFFYWEDVDLGFRAREHGWRLEVADDCRVVHDEGSTLGRWSAARWRHLFAGLVVLIGDRLRRGERIRRGDGMRRGERVRGGHAMRWTERMRGPALPIARRLVRHTLTMARHGRWAAIGGAWQGACDGLRRARTPGRCDVAPSPGSRSRTFLPASPVP